MKRGFYNCKFVLAAVAASIAVGANADDAAGVMRASASNEYVTVVMPFSPFAPGAPQGGPASVPATLEYAYQYDDIGNRITSTDLGTNRTYTANSLNQYSAIRTSDLGLQTSSFEPQYPVQVVQGRHAVGLPLCEGQRGRLAW